MGILKQLIFLLLLVQQTECKKQRVRERTRTDFFIRSLLTEQNLRTTEVDSDAEKDFYPLDSSATETIVPGDIPAPRHGGRHNSGLLRTSQGGTDMGDIMQAMRDFGILEVSQDNAAVSYMLDLYQKLEGGANIPQAVGHNKIDVAILRADTVRSMPAKGNEILLFHNI